jgi:predicted RecB family nuclease
MQLQDSRILISASDLMAFLECEHVTALDFAALGPAAQGMVRTVADESAELVARKGIEHERAYLARLQGSGLTVVDIGQIGTGLGKRLAATLDAMRGGADVVYQATLGEDELIGHADFLLRVQSSSTFGHWSYEVADTKLARTPKAKFMMQLAFYSHLLARAQQAEPQRMHVMLGDQTERSFACSDFVHYFRALLARYRRRVVELQTGRALDTYPVPCGRCDLCHWRDRCRDQRVADDHLCLVADIRRVQWQRLQQAGVQTVAALAAMPGGTKVPRMHADTLVKLASQAALQDHQRRTGERRHLLLPDDPACRRGFFRLPPPDAGDLFFDMEGDPLEEGGLEYLFGVGYRQAGEWQFRAFWAHNRADELQAFEQFMDFVVARRRQYPGAHVYHYASYEETALKRLACQYGTREAALDDMLRKGVLVDLYKVVRESVRISEPSYSIKYVEHFYRPPRAGEVQNAGASIVWYERWRETRDPALLHEIEAYNRDDVESTWQLHEWLLGLRPPNLPWRAMVLPPAATEPDAGTTRAQGVELRLQQWRQRLVDGLPAKRADWSVDDQVRELAWQLLDFHRRADKPGWWALYARMDQTEEELIEDPECLAGLTLDPEHPPVQERRSTVYTYIVSEQETKLRSGAACTRCDTGQSVDLLEFNESARRVRLKIGPNKEALPTRLNIGPNGPLDAKALVEALYRFAEDLVTCGSRYQALHRMLRREPPRLRGRASGNPIIPPGTDLVQGSIAAAQAMERTHLYVQGPPGAGKTHTGSRMIIALLQQGLRVGILSNSHKAIHNLLAGVLDAAREQGVPVRAVKKASRGNPETEYEDPEGRVENLGSNEDVWRSGAQLVAGTAWLFADDRADQQLDALFVDEAGQVALANLVAAGTSARNIVLLGDQMQLAQPVQGVHPGRSGDSALDYLLDGAATIAAERGIFLTTSWRMNPAICSFISEAVYEGRLMPERGNAQRTLVLAPDAHALLRPAGLVHAPVDHNGCSQASEPEADLIAHVYESALRQRYTDRAGRIHGMTTDNILVMAPYNVQVNLLKRRLPAGARVGTVDKFQGQEAELVLVSMTTSSELELPRNIEFLYSKNRLNVAISRARCLAVVVANPKLNAIGCRTPEQMALVNLLCWIAEVGR